MANVHVSTDLRSANFHEMVSQNGSYWNHFGKNCRRQISGHTLFGLLITIKHTLFSWVSISAEYPCGSLDLWDPLSGHLLPSPAIEHANGLMEEVHVQGPIPAQKMRET